MIAVNTGFGDDYSAAQEVEYCNGSADTIGGSWRAKNGHAEPYGVKYWCVGNEMWGTWQLGFMQLDQYVAEAQPRRQRDAQGRSEPGARRLRRPGQRGGDRAAGRAGMLERLRRPHGPASPSTSTSAGDRTTTSPQHVAPDRGRDSQQGRRPSQTAGRACRISTGRLDADRDGRVELLVPSRTSTANSAASTGSATHSASPPACTNTSATATSSRWPTTRRR